MKPVVRGAIRQLIELQLEHLVEYVDLLETAIKRKEKILSEMIDRTMESVSEENKPWMTGDQFGGDIGLVVESLPRLLWYGAFVSIYSYYEHEMLHLARRDLRMNKGAFPIALAAKYHKLMYTWDAEAYWKAKGIAFPDSGKPWKELGIFGDIRNQIAHEGGIQDGTARSNKIRKYVTSRLRGRKKSLTIKQDKTTRQEPLVLTADFCREAIETVKIFFSELIAVLP